MVQVEEVSTKQTYVQISHEPILSKYNIPVEHLDFAYIEKCKNAKELEHILEILRSGEEGHYPQLTEYAANKLAAIKPKSRLLGVQTPVLRKEDIDDSEWKTVSKDLEQWTSVISKHDKELQDTRIDPCFTTPIRQQENIETVKHKQTKRISATDYSSWDKYDVDTEILKMDLEDDRMKKEALKKRQDGMKNNKRVEIVEPLTDAEANHLANQLKNRGNEAFKTCDYSEALEFYNQSLKCKPTLAVYNNRAITNIKLQNYENALNDCEKVLTEEPENVKALFRKAQAFSSLNKNEEAIACLEKLILIDPNNTVAQNIMNKLQKSNKNETRKTRMKIEDSAMTTKNKPATNKSILKKRTTETTTKPKKVLIPIPGTSKSTGPDIVEVFPSKEIVCSSSTRFKAIKPNKTDGYNDSKITEIENRPDQNPTQIKANAATKAKPEKSTSTTNHKKNEKIDVGGSGEPYKKLSLNDINENEVTTPYGFMKLWYFARDDESLGSYALIMRSIPPSRLSTVIGCSLDGSMLGTMFRCLSRHFTVPGDIALLGQLLTEIVRLPRFDINILFMQGDELAALKHVTGFLTQHGHALDPEVAKKLSQI